MKLIIKIGVNGRWRQVPRGEIAFSYHDFFPDERPINSSRDKHSLKPGHKIARVRGNQAGINTQLVPFFLFLTSFLPYRLTLGGH